jgi:Cu-Zn family superoxide dismutase
VLVVNNDGKATDPVVAPRLKKLDEVKGKALMIHVGGDNMSDQPKPLGGGGARYACGVI